MRPELLKALTVPPPGRFDLSMPAAALTLEQYQTGQALGRSLPRPEEVFTAGAFGPFTPMRPLVIDRPGPSDIPEPRVWQYPPGWNLPTPPRAIEPVSFEVLRSIAQTVDVVRKAIEVIKKEVASTEWDIVLRDDQLTKTKGKDYLREEKIQLRNFFERPDPLRGLFFDEWVREILEEVLVIDALTLYPHPAVGRGRGPLGSDIVALEVLDGSLIKPLVDIRGQRPQPPAPAYQQFLYGVPRSEFAAAPEEPPVGEWDALSLIYKPYNVRSHTVFGFPPTEQVIVNAITYIRRCLWWQAYFTDSDIPAMFISGGEGWTPDELERWEAALHSLMAADPGWKWRLKAIPHGSKVEQIKQPTFDIAFDEYLIRLIALCFDVTPAELGFSPDAGLGGKGWSEEQAAVGERKGRRPLLRWLANLFSWIIKVYFNQPELAFRWLGLEVSDAERQARIDKIYIDAGVRTRNEVREEHGWDARPEPAASEPLLMTQSGPMPLRLVDMGPSPEPGTPSGSGLQPAAKEGMAAGDALAELARFQKFALARLGRASRRFTFVAVPAYLAARLNAALASGQAELVKATTNAARAKALQEKAAQELAALAQELRDGQIDEDEFEERATALLRGAYGAAIALGGGEDVEDDWSEQEAERQRSFLRDFARAVADMSAAAIGARAALYAGQIWAGYQRGRAKAAPSGARIVWHTSDDDAVCALCAQRDGQEYAGLEDLPGFPGDGNFGDLCEGGPNCRCWLEYLPREEEEEEEEES